MECCWKRCGCVTPISKGIDLPSISPYVLKLETFLRIHRIKYVNDFEQPLSEKGKCPWITFNGILL